MESESYKIIWLVVLVALAVLGYVLIGPGSGDTFELSYACRPTFQVEKNAPELTASEEYAQSCYSQTTEYDCKRVDVYSQYLKAFGSPDGKGDCRWTR
jgi:hypothetical protein